jgi:hypothetical protein
MTIFDVIKYPVSDIMITTKEIEDLPPGVPTKVLAYLFDSNEYQHWQLSEIIRKVLLEYDE